MVGGFNSRHRCLCEVNSMNIMTRLTFDGDFCDISMCRFVPGGSFCEDGDCSQRRGWERLKSIEDILGGDYNLDRLRELVEADREGVT